MKHSFTAIAALLIGLAAAEHGGHNHVHRHQYTKRNGDTVWVTVTDTVITTHTKTVWVDASDPTGGAKAYTQQDDSQPLGYQNFKQQDKVQTPQKDQKQPQSHEKAAKYQAPDSTKPQDKTAAPFDPLAWQKHQEEIQQGNIEKQQELERQQQQQQGQPPAQVAPVDPHVKEAAMVPPLKEAPVVQPVKPVGPVVPPPTRGNKGGPPGGSTLNTVPGIMTFYDPYDNPGACGWKIAQDAQEVALAASIMGDKAKCGQMITIKGPNGSFPAKVADKCVACETDFGNGINHIDVPREYAAKIAASTFTTEEAFEKSPLYGAGHLSDVTWEWA